jgi:magnesium-transporting ATPase (P-type)
MTGPALAAVEKYALASEQSYSRLLREICPFVTLFARVSPTQKEAILLALQDAKCITLMYTLTS